MTKPLHLLLVEDSEDDARLMLRELQKVGYEVAWKRVETQAALKQTLTEQAWDLIICDYYLPQFDALHALEILKDSGMDLPFIIVSGTIGEETAVTALKAGAHDFLIKGNYARLGPAIERELREADSRRERRQAIEALREKERLLSEAQRIGHIGSWNWDLAADTLQFSDEMYRLLDVSPQEFQHNSNELLALIHPEDRPIMENWVDELRGGGQINELDFRIRLRDGSARYLHCSGAYLHDASGRPVRFIGTAQDVTERKLAEMQINKQINRLLALRRIDEVITSSFDLRLILNTLLRQALEQLQVDAADVLLLNEDRYTLDYLTGQGFRSISMENLQVPLNNSYTGRAVLERRLVQIADMKAYPLLIRKMPGEEFVCYYGIPLINKGKVNGVLEIFHRASLQPDPEWMSFFETLAGQAAIAIDNAGLFEKLQRSNLELGLAYNATIEGWSRALDLRDKETEGHTQRVTEMTLKLARYMGIPEEQLVHIHRGVLLHDIGKMGVPDDILLKPGPLTEEEWEIMRRHPQLAYDWLAPISFLQQSLEIPYCHHEKWDGTGYPRGLKEEEIPLSARIFAVADVWDALTNDRPYRKAWSKEEALEYIRENSGGHFDPQVVNAFLERIVGADM
ncbi:MAG: PAS domain-containing protein [Anaerolineales bacterium]|nr:PAS domain-containing protein [Anaerolineales bacterium]